MQLFLRSSLSVILFGAQVETLLLLAPNVLCAHMWLTMAVSLTFLSFCMTIYTGEETRETGEHKNAPIALLPSFRGGGRNL